MFVEMKTTAFTKAMFPIFPRRTQVFQEYGLGSSVFLNLSPPCPHNSY